MPVTNDCTAANFMIGCHSCQLSIKNFQEQQLNSRRFPVFPEKNFNFRRFPVFPEVVDALTKHTVSHKEIS